jgi:hypothetical protein
MTEPVSEPRESFWQRPELLPWLYLLLLIVLCAVAVWRPLTGSEDFWAHAAVGRWIWEHQSVPQQTLFLWSTSERWTAHSWLAQLVFYGVTTIGPASAFSTVLLAFTTILVALPFVVAWHIAARKGRVSSWMMLPFALGIITNFAHYHARPELFTTVFVSGLFYFLVRWSEAPSPNVWQRGTILFAFFVVWVNFDSNVVAGLVLLALTAVCDLLQDRIDRRSRALFVLALLAPLAVCVNPYGLGYWTFESRAAGRLSLFASWHPVWKVTPLPREQLLVQGILLTLALLAWARNPQRRLSHLGWLLSTCALYAGAGRAGLLLTVVSLHVMAANANGLALEEIWQRVFRGRAAAEDARQVGIPSSIRWMVRFGLASWLLLQIAMRGLALTQYDRPFLPVQLETGVVQFTKTHGLDGRMFNDIENSRYLEWRLAGETLLFIDGQSPYPEDVGRDYDDIIKATPQGQRALQERDIGFVVLTVTRKYRSPGPLARFLDRDQHWKRVYVGWDGIIWVRRTPEYAHLWRHPGRAIPSVSFDYLELWTRREVGPHIMFSP